MRVSADVITQKSTLTEEVAGGPVAVLASGGLDSCVLIGELLSAQVVVHPIYVRGGLSWEATEQHHLHEFLRRIANPGLQPVQFLDLPVTDLYGAHWSVTGKEVPDADSPDSAVYLPGRNVLLLAKALLWCHVHDVPAVALATLKGNPFPDATPKFFKAYQDAVNQAVGGNVRILRPYAMLSKTEVMQHGRGLPLQWSFSCIQPVRGRHCGRCNKCAERRGAFANASLPDETEYDAEESCTA